MTYFLTSRAGWLACASALLFALPIAGNPQRQLSDGTSLQLVAVFHTTLEERAREDLPDRSPKGTALTIWTTRRGLGNGRYRTQAVLVDAAGRRHKLIYGRAAGGRGGSSELSEQWEYPSPPPLGEPVRLRFAPDAAGLEREAVEFEVRYTEDWSSRQFDGRTANDWMAEAIDRSDRRLIRTLLKRGAHANVRDPFGWTALMIAARDGDLEIETECPNCKIRRSAWDLAHGAAAIGL